MKALILSDIHSNIFALEAVWTQENDADLIVCTGDLVDYGPFPKQVIEWVRAHDVICTQGNHDRWVARQFRQGRTAASLPPDERAWANHNAALLSEDDIRFLERLPTALSMELDGIHYGLTHLYKEYEEIVSLHAFQHFLEQTFDQAPIQRLILGHTHRQAVRYLSDERLWLNPGSVAYRRRDDPDQHAHYATLTDGAISLRRIPYDLRPLQQALEGIELMASEMQVARRFYGRRNFEE